LKLFSYLPVNTYKHWKENKPCLYLQDLTLIISTELSEAEIELAEDIEEISSVQIDSFAKQQEWRLHECVSITPKVTTKAYTNPKYKNPAVVVGCFAGRRAGFFVWNVMLIMVNKKK
jgi:hypothetical protein